MKRVPLSRGARPPGRGPPWTSSVGERALRTSDRLAEPMPSSRHRGETTEHDDRRRFDGGDERWVARLGEQRIRGDAHDALDSERSICEQPARVPPAQTHVCLRPDQPKRQIHCRGEPGGELESRPVVHTAAERNEDSLATRPVGRRACEQSDVGGRALEQRGDIARQLSPVDVRRRVEKDERDVGRRRQAVGVVGPCARRESGRPHVEVERLAACVQAPPRQPPRRRRRRAGARR